MRRTGLGWCVLSFAVLPAYVLAVYLWPWDFSPRAFILLLAPLMLVGGMRARFESARAREAATLLGAASFPLYAVHYPAIQLLKTEWGPMALAAMAVAGILWHRRARLAAVLAPKAARLNPSSAG